MFTSQISAREQRARPEEDFSTWLPSLRIYLGVTFIGNLIWETLQLPLYTIWQTGTLYDQVFAVIHCTFADLLIALSTLTIALVLVARSTWPTTRFWHVAGLTVLLGVGYTIFSEWLNVVVRASWAYSELMPVIPIGAFQVGVSPLMQWVSLPAVAFMLTRRWVTAERCRKGHSA